MPTPYITKRAQYDTRHTFGHGVVTDCGYIPHYRHRTGIDLPVAVKIIEPSSVAVAVKVGGKYAYALPAGKYFIP